MTYRFSEGDIRSEVALGGRKIILLSKDASVLRGLGLLKSEHIFCFGTDGRLLWNSKFIDPEGSWWFEEIDAFRYIQVNDAGELIAGSFRGKVYLVNLVSGDLKYIKEVR